MPQDPKQTPHPIGGHMVDVPGHGMVWVPAGTDDATAIQTAQTGGPSLPLANQVISGRPNPQLPFTGKDIVKMLGTVVALGGGMLTGPMIGLGEGATIPLRLAMTGLGGAAENPDDPQAGAADQMKWQLGGEAAAKLLPKAGTYAGYLFGGKIKGIQDAVDAVMRQRDARGFGRAIPPGAVGKLDEAIAEGNAKLATAKATSPVTIPMTQVTGAADKMAKDAANINTYPGDFRKTISDAEDKFIRQQYEARTGLPAPRTIPSQALASAVNISPSDMQDFKVAQSRLGENVVKGRSAGAFIPEGEELNATTAANRAKLATEGITSAEKAAGIPPTDPRSITGANANLSDLFTMRNANNDMSNLHTIARAGIMSGRAGLGAGLGYGAAHMVGADPALGGTLGSLAGLTFFSPRGAADVGMAGGRAAESMPSIMRGLSLLQEALDASDKLKRKTPTGGS